MKLTLSQLLKKGACEEGIQALKKVLGDKDVWEGEWTKERQIQLMLTPVGKYIGWACQQGLLPLWEMSGADLRGANLSGANLYGVKGHNP